MLAHLAAQATRHDPQARLGDKLGLTRRLYERGFPRRRIIDLYRFLDWLLRLPDDLELQYSDVVFAIEEGFKMPYLSYVERRGEARGAAVLLRGLLEERFGELPTALVERLKQADGERLLAWSRRVLRARTIDEVFAAEEG